MAPVIYYLNKAWQDLLDGNYFPFADLVILDPIYESKDFSYIPAAYDCMFPGASIYVFADASGVAETKLELDKYFDFQNWLIWGPNDWGGRSSRRWGQKHDDILFYTKPGAPHFFNGEAVQVPKTMTSPAFNPSGRTHKIPNSVWNDLGGFSTQSAERVKIDGKCAPYQKPEAVIERIIKASSRERDFVLDFFSGVGTVPAVCRRLNRHCMATEINTTTYNAGVTRLGYEPLGQEIPRCSSTGEQLEQGPEYQVWCSGSTPGSDDCVHGIQRVSERD